MSEQKVTSEKSAANKAFLAAERQTPPDLHEYSAPMFRYKRTGDLYGLKIVPNDAETRGKTYRLKNELNYWEGTKAQFEQEFEEI